MAQPGVELSWSLGSDFCSLFIGKVLSLIWFGVVVLVLTGVSLWIFVEFCLQPEQWVSSMVVLLFLFCFLYCRCYVLFSTVQHLCDSCGHELGQTLHRCDKLSPPRLPHMAATPWTKLCSLRGKGTEVQEEPFCPRQLLRASRGLRLTC